MSVSSRVNPIKAKRGTDMRKKTKINKDLAEAPGGEGDGEEKKKSKSRVLLFVNLIPTIP